MELELRQLPNIHYYKVRQLNKKVFDSYKNASVYNSKKNTILHNAIEINSGIKKQTKGYSVEYWGKGMHVRFFKSFAQAKRYLLKLK